jgi:predicted dinucleotide-binding enzyme
MKIGILGTGDVGRALAKGFSTLGHDVKIGGREAKDGVVTFADAAAFGELVVLATKGTANESALRLAGLDHLRGKILIDATNPLNMTASGPMLSITGEDSAGEQVQRLVPEAKVVKAWNTVGNAQMFRPSYKEGRPTMLIAGNDAGAKQKVVEILDAFGWDSADVGGIDGSRFLEAMCIAWCRIAIKTGVWTHAFKVLQKPA